jgi:hypothetical protein
MLAVVSFWQGTILAFVLSVHVSIGRWLSDYSPDMGQFIHN